MDIDIANNVYIDALIQGSAFALLVFAAVARVLKKRDLAHDLLYFSIACSLVYIGRNW